MMSFTISTAVLRRVLWLDAVGGWGMALMHFLLADALAAWTGVPATWVQLAGELVLVPACMAAWLATRVQPPAGGGACWPGATRPGCSRACGLLSAPAWR